MAGRALLVAAVGALLCSESFSLAAGEEGGGG